MDRFWEKMAQFGMKWGSSSLYKSLAETHDSTVKVTDLEETNAFFMDGKDTDMK